MALAFPDNYIAKSVSFDGTLSGNVEFYVNSTTKYTVQELKNNNNNVSLENVSSPDVYFSLQSGSSLAFSSITLEYIKP